MALVPGGPPITSVSKQLISDLVLTSDWSGREGYLKCLQVRRSLSCHPHIAYGVPCQFAMSKDETRQDVNLTYIQYDGEQEAKYLSAIRQLISKDLSEPYSIYVYRYFLYQWGDLCFMVSPASRSRGNGTREFLNKERFTTYAGLLTLWQGFRQGGKSHWRRRF